MARPLNAPRPLPSVETLKALLSYSSETGELTWKLRELSTFRDVGIRSAEALWKRWNTRFAGKRAGGPYSNYWRVMVENDHHMAHRLIWKMAYGTEPLFIDHIDGNGRNNRLENLRDVSHVINAKNRKMYENNSSGINGVSWHARDQVWSARIGVGEGEELHLGSFRTREEAIAARMAGDKLLDYHENHGKIRKE